MSLFYLKRLIAKPYSSKVIQGLLLTSSLFFHQTLIAQNSDLRSKSTSDQNIAKNAHKGAAQKQKNDQKSNNPCPQNDQTCQANLSAYTDKIYTPLKNNKQHEKVLANALGWVKTPKQGNNLCGGYYIEPGQYSPSKYKKRTKTYLSFGSGNIKPQGTIMASGGVEISQGSQRISAKKAKIKTDPETKNIKRINVQGNVNISQKGKLLISKKGHTNIQKNKSKLVDVYYLISTGHNQGMGKSTSFLACDRSTGYARGHADEIKQTDKNRFVLKNASLTTSNPYVTEWELSANTLIINQNTGWGQAYNSTFAFYDVPIFYWPYIAFPTTTERKSGLLYPSAGFQSESGYYYSQPLYLNLAPNYDLTLTGEYYTKRGPMIKSHFRYLWPSSKGSFNIEYLPYDYDANKGRASLHFRDKRQYTQHLRSLIDVNYNTDDSFERDFAANDIFTANKTLLSQKGQLTYKHQNWHINAQLLHYQVINADLRTINQPYSTLPKINLNASYPDSIEYVSFSIENQLTYFYKDPNQSQSLVNGQRYIFEPKISLPIERVWGYVTPSIELSQSFYSLQNRSRVVDNQGNVIQNAYPDAVVSRTLPIFNVKSGLYFDRQVKLSKESFKQTIEPKLFYTYIPFDDQDNIPVFGSSFTTFTYDTLFRTNRFTGLDRINNANQLTYAIETRLTNSASGDLLLNAGIGQMVYFQDRKVSLCRSSGCIDSENPRHDNRLSPVAGFFKYQLSENWYAQADISYDVYGDGFTYQNYAFQYIPNRNYIFNIGYQDIAHDYGLLTPSEISDGEPGNRRNQFSTSAIWKLSTKWSVVGLWSYDLRTDRTINAFAGIQFDSCSWAFRILAQNFLSTSNVNLNDPTKLTDNVTSSIMFQIEFKGLGSSGSGDFENTLKSIPGFQSNHASQTSNGCGG